MLILLDLNDAAVLEGPPHHVRLVADAPDVLGLVDGRPELGEVGQLDEVPDVRERRPDHGALNHLVGGGDGFSALRSHLFGQICGLVVLLCGANDVQRAPRMRQEIGNLIQW